MANSEELYFDKLEAECDGDPECITYGLLLEATETICKQLTENVPTGIEYVDEPAQARELARAMGMPTTEAQDFLSINDIYGVTLYQIVEYAQAVGLKVELNLIEGDDDE